MKENHPKEKHYPLNEYEQDIEDHYDSGPTLPPEEEKAKMELLKLAAKGHLHKDKRITIRICTGDLEAIRHLASEEGLPYQTFIASVLHKLAAGRLVDVNDLKKHSELLQGK